MEIYLIFLVVVDQRENKNVDTGQFELVYKQRMSSCQPCLGSTLSIQGNRLTVCDKKLSFETKFNPILKTPSVSCIPFLKVSFQVVKRKKKDVVFAD